MFALRSIRQRAAARLLNPSSSSTVQSRSTHYVPQLDGTGSKEWPEKGIGRFMSPQQFDISWTQNQGRLVDRLNGLTNGGTYENSSTKQILLATARDPDYAPHFNYASLAHNTHFFFSTLSPNPTRPSADFGQELESCFSSAASFRASFLATAEAMFGPGFVWLIQRNGERAPSKYAILCTYQAGSPYPGATFRKQDKDASNTPNNYSMGMGAGDWASRVETSYRRHQKHDIAPGGQELTPLMCVSTWEHMYLQDYGVNGKRAYLERWWDSVDWNKVEANVTKNLHDKVWS